MLLNLHVKNFALIDECEVDFNKGLNILTGETGAGKSIIIDSINYALGAKVPKDVIRHEDEPALIELIFDIENDNVREALQDMDIACDDDTVIISKKLQNSRSVSKINGETVSAGQVKKIAELLIDIHGQHEHQSLLNNKKHLEILDDYGKEKIAPAKDVVKTLYKEYVSIREELEGSRLDEEAKLREVSFLEHEIKEIEDAKLIAGEDEELEKEYKRLSNGRKIIEALSETYDITGYGGRESAGDGIGTALKRLSYVTEYDDQLESLYAELAQIEGLLNDFNRGLSNYMADNEFSQEEFAQVESRLNTINDLKGKYGASIELVQAALEKRKNRIEELNNYDQYIAKLEKRLSVVETDLKEESIRLSDIRKAYALELCQGIAESLKDLNFLQVDFTMEFTKRDYSINGIDQAEFMLSTNPGEAVRPLGQVASGGELSRVMLAIKTILASSDEIPTLIFDEIDTGISGRTAQKVSEKLSLVGRLHQVICITHLPQIAAMADSHYVIQKNIVNGATVSEIRVLSQDDSVAELARMLGGAEITEAVLRNAYEMKELAKQLK